MNTKPLPTLPAPEANLGSAAHPDLAELLDTLDPEADLVQRHLWLIALLRWIRGTRPQPEAALARVEILLDLLDARAGMHARLQRWWCTVVVTLDSTTLLSDYGFATRNAFVTELVQRLHGKLLPANPATRDISELFAMVLSDPQDAVWIAALPVDTLQRLAVLLGFPASSPVATAHRAVSHWQNALLEAISFCTSQISAAGFSPELRLRMDASARESSPFHRVMRSWEDLRDAWLHGAAVDDLRADFRSQLEQCRQAASAVYAHLDEHGISMDLVFRLRQLRERVVRIRTLLDCLLHDGDHRSSARLVALLARLGFEQRSIRGLLLATSSMLAAKVAERNAETGAHYITRTPTEYRGMLRQAAGGGALTVLTTVLKFGLVTLGLSAFWQGFAAGLVYAASFVLIQLLHCTLATKQPAMTAPAMAERLKDMGEPDASERFVDEVTHLVRSQVAAIIGNVGAVFPLVIALSVLVQLASGQPLIDAQQATYVLHALALPGPTLLFAAFTGVLLFGSSVLGGCAENWFALHRLRSAIAYNPRITAWLGPLRARRWAQFLQQEIAGLSSNIALGLLLGLVPPVLGFLGLGLDVRHVTLSSGQLGAAAASLGWAVLEHAAWWWAVASIPLIGMLNVGVSFYLAFRVALRAHNVGDAGLQQIYHSLRQRLRRAPGSFFWPAAAQT